jgi:hypothetical protein
MICANRLAPAALFAIGCAGLPAVRTVQSQTYFKQTSSPAATHRLLRSLRGGNERISPADRFWADHAPLGSYSGPEVPIEDRNPVSGADARMFF